METSRGDVAPSTAGSPHGAILRVICALMSQRFVDRSSLVNAGISPSAQHRLDPPGRNRKLCHGARTLKCIVDCGRNGGANRCDPAFTGTLETIGIERAWGIFAH